MNYQSYQRETKPNIQPRTIYVLPSRQPVNNVNNVNNRPTTQYTVIRPAYTLPPVAPRIQQVKQEPARQVQAVKRRLEPVTNDVFAELLGETNEHSGPRKRERLTHLTAEEKLDRRKMRNRVAAQTARDRKKERSGKMEDVMRNLLAENQRLAEENRQLKEENRNLKISVEQSYQSSANFTSCDHQQQQQQVGGNMCVAGAQVNEPLESAAFISAPLLRVQARCMALQQATSTNHNQLTIHKLLALISLIRLASSKSMMNSSKSTRSLKISRFSSDIDIDKLVSTLPPLEEDDDNFLATSSSSSASSEISSSRSMTLSPMSHINTMSSENANTISEWEEGDDVLFGDPILGYQDMNLNIEPKSSPHSSSSSFVDPLDVDFWTNSNNPADEQVDYNFFDGQSY